MKLALVTAALAATLAAPAFAGESQDVTIQDIRQMTGVGTSDLRVLLGAQSTPGRYPFNQFVARQHYERALQRLRDGGIALESRDGVVRMVRIAAVPQARVQVERTL